MNSTKYEIGISETVMGNNSPFVLSAVDEEEKAIMMSLLIPLLSIGYINLDFLSDFERIGTFLAEGNHGN